MAGFEAVLLVEFLAAFSFFFEDLLPQLDQLPQLEDFEAGFSVVVLAFGFFWVSADFLLLLATFAPVSEFLDFLEHVLELLVQLGERMHPDLSALVGRVSLMDDFVDGGGDDGCGLPLLTLIKRTGDLSTTG